MVSAIYLPLLTYPDPAPVQGLTHALDLAATVGGTISASVVLAKVPPITNPLATAINTSAMAAAAEETSRRTGTELSDQFSLLARRLGIPAEPDSFASRPELIPESIAERARTFDATFLPFDAASNPHRSVAQGVLFGSGGPVILFPPNEAATHLETVAIAWDGGAAAARAVRDALPMLRLAKRVVILTVQADKQLDAKQLDAMHRYLLVHGIDAQHRDQEAAGRSVGEVLQSQAQAEDAGLIVMGAYGHSRLFEFVLGGATRSTLENLRLPTLMSH